MFILTNLGHQEWIEKKHLAHTGISRCSDCSICALKWNTFHRKDIISVSLSLITPFLIYTNVCLPVANIGVSWSKIRSFVYWVFGACKCTGWPSRMRRRSCHGITWADHRKSFRKIHSACSAPTQANVVVDGLENVANTLFKGFRIKSFSTISRANNKYISVFTSPFV